MRVFSQVQGLLVRKEKRLFVYQWGEWFMESAIAVWASNLNMKLQEDFLLGCPRKIVNG